MYELGNARQRTFIMDEFYDPSFSNLKGTVATKFPGLLLLLVVDVIVHIVFAFFSCIIYSIIYLFFVLELLAAADEDKKKKILKHTKEFITRFINKVTQGLFIYSIFFLSFFFFLS